MAQPTTYLGVAMLAFIFAALSYLLIQSRTAEEDDAKRSGENVARMKYVTLGQLVGDLRVIKEGIGPDDRVIVNGLMRARPGAKVTPQEQPATPAAGPQAKS